MKPLVLRLEPELPELESEYRQYYLKRDISQVTIGIILWVMPYLAFAHSDYLMFGFTPTFYHLLILRVLYLGISLLTINFLKKKITQYQDFDRLVLLWSAYSVFWTVIVSLKQFEGSLALIVLALVGVVSFYAFLPNPFKVRIIAPLFYSACALLTLFLVNQTSDLAFVEATVYAFVIINVVGILFSGRLYDSRRKEYLAHIEEAKARVELQRLASTDPLTGVLNRRRLLELAGETFYRFRRYKRPFSILVMDLDGFKNLNDTLGHQQGDAVLIEFAEAVNREKREADALGRMGGDEFCLVLPETLPQAASALAQRIIEKCQAIAPGNGALDVSVTVSIGISEICPEDGTLDSLFSRADAALYRAKNDGRNRWKII